MNSNPKLSYAIAAILSGASPGFADAASAATDTETSSDSIQEITVTAQRRTENLQDVPITIQALTGETLKQLNVATFDDFIKFLPNVTQGSAGPGQSSIFMRGLSVGFTGEQGTGTTGPIPNVAVYLDEQSSALPGRNLDVYAADLERIEVLEGPQGTLFGSGAQAGVLRYITNKPKLDTTEGNVNAGYSYTAGGDPNSNLDAMINLPLIPGTFAVRAVIYDDRRGGYINNVPATFARQGTDEGLSRYNGGVVPTNSVVINNAGQVGKAINTVNYKGFRLSGLWKINEDWDALLTQSYQNMDSQGVFYEMPNGPEGITFDKNGVPIGGRPLPPYSVALFNPSYNKDKFEDTTMTVSGKIGDLKVVYAGGYLVRNIEQQQDYTNYARGVFGYYYQCAGYSSTSAAAGQCYTPSSVWQDTEKNTHQSHEIRVSTPDDWRIRGIGGLYWEEFKIYDNTDWLYKSVPTCTPAFNDNCFHNVGPRPGEPANDPSVRNDNTGFVDDSQRTITQKAAFGSMDLDLIPKRLILTLGTRYYKFDERIAGGDFGSFYCKEFAPTTYFGPCDPTKEYGTNLSAQAQNHSNYHGFRSRANLSWHATDDLLIYYTWSQGFRPGGFNRGTSAVQVQNGVAQYLTPEKYDPDTLTNNELGVKSEWLGHRLEINGAVYQEDWKNTIVEFFDPQGGFGNLTFVTNGPIYRVRGVEVQIVARAAEGLTVQGSASWNSSTETNSPSILNNNPASPGYGKPVLGANGLPIPNVYGPEGSPLANSPPFQANLRVRYDFNLMDYKPFVQVGGQHMGNSYTGSGNVNSYSMPGFTTYDASLGASKDAWTVQLFGQNLTSVNASTFTNSFQFIKTETVLRPRVLGVKFSYKF